MLIFREAEDSGTPPSMKLYHFGTSGRFFTFRRVRAYADPCSDPRKNPRRNGTAFSDTLCGDDWGKPTLAIAQNWSSDGVITQSGIVFNSTYKWNVYSGPYQAGRWEDIEDFRRIAAHELGHAIGLDHEDDVPAIMATYADDIEAPQADDIAGVAAIYGESPPTGGTPPPNNDDAFATLIFPQVADGSSSDDSFFRTTISLTNKSARDANCTLILYGMETDFGAGRGSLFTVTVPGNGFMSARTTGAGRLQSGYATVGCDRRISGQLTYATYDASGTKFGEATVFPTEVESSSYSMIVDGRDGARLGLAIANDTNHSRIYNLTLRDREGYRVSTGSVTVPARSNVAEFLNDLISPPPASGHVYLLEVRSSDRSDFSMIGLHVTGFVFFDSAGQLEGFPQQRPSPTSWRSEERRDSRNRLLP